MAYGSALYWPVTSPLSQTYLGWAQILEANRDKETGSTVHWTGITYLQTHEDSVQHQKFLRTVDLEQSLEYRTAALFSFATKSNFEPDIVPYSPYSTMYP